jgi:hypothetical protein
MTTTKIPKTMQTVVDAVNEYIDEVGYGKVRVSTENGHIFYNIELSKYSIKRREYPIRYVVMVNLGMKERYFEEWQVYSDGYTAVAGTMNLTGISNTNLIPVLIAHFKGTIDSLELTHSSRYDPTGSLSAVDIYQQQPTTQNEGVAK